MLKTSSCKALPLKSPLESLTKLPLSKSLVSEALNYKTRGRYFEIPLPISVWGLQFYVKLEQKCKVILTINLACNEIAY